MEEEKGSNDHENDSVADSSDFSSSESSSNEEEDSMETDIWKKGNELLDPSFPENCIKNFKISDETEHLPKDKTNTPLKCFMLFFNNDILESIVKESIKYFEQQVAKGIIKKSENPNSAFYFITKYGLNKYDILLYFGALIYMGLNGKHDQKNHWGDDAFYTPFYLHNFISITKYESIREIFHLVDNNMHIGMHPFYKISDFLVKISFLSRKYYAPSQNLTIDESMISYRGRAKFKAYIPSKPTKWGLKLHALCESETGYCLNFALDPGKTVEKPKDYVFNLILGLFTPYFKKYHILYTDSYYTSIPLLEKLRSELTGVVGMINKNRKGLPKSFICEKSKSSIESVSNGNAMLTKFKDKKTVLCISSIFNSDVVEMDENKKSKSKKVPKCIYYYSKFMRGVDSLDQAIQTYRFPHRSKKWWIRVFHHIMEIVIHNSYYIFRKANSEKNFSPINFRKDLCENLLKKGSKIRVEKKDVLIIPKKLKFNEKYFVEKSYLHHMILADSQRCVQCLKKTEYHCQQCGVALHPLCFGAYHIEEIEKD